MSKKHKENDTELKKLSKELQDKIAECNQLVQSISALAHESNDHHLKFYALTEISARYFSPAGLSKSAASLVEHVNKKSRKES
jgi:hypothetical protein